MKYEWDETKNTINIIKHGVSFDIAVYFEWEKATHEPDTRCDYGEPRVVSFAPVHARTFALLWTPRGDVVRIIGLRKANKREVKRHENKA